MRRSTMWKPLFAVSLICSLATGLGFAQPAMQSATPKELVAAYDSLADTILSADKAEENLVLAILSTTYGHAIAGKAKAEAKIAAGESARLELESVAALVSQLGNEGDSAVAGVRKRLVEGGHHHNSKGEEQGLYDEGFVIVTRSAKKVFLEAATEIGRLARTPSAQSLQEAWQKVDKQYQDLMKDHR
jgi:riboflavin biosynthesis pyrimidine reductase